MELFDGFSIEDFPVAMTLYDESLKPTDCNEVALKLFDVADKREYITHFNELMIPRQRSGNTSHEMLREHIKKAFDEGYSHLPEFICCKHNGSILALENTYTRRKHGEGFVVIEYMRDITDKVEAEQREREAVLTQKNLYNANPIPTTIWTLEDFKLVDCSQASVDLIGAKDKQDHLENFHKFTPKYQACGTSTEIKIQELNERVKNEGVVRDVWLQLHSSGDMIPGEITLVKMDINGKQMVAAYFQDLRPLRAADDRLREASELTQVLLDNSPAFIEIWDEDLNFLDCNQQIMEVIGVSNKEEYEKRYYEFCPEYQPDGTRSAEIFQLHAATTLSKGSSRYEWVRKSAAGELILLDVSEFSVEVGGKRLLVSYSNDLRLVKDSIQKKNEREMSERIQLMFDAAPLMIEYWDKSCTPIECNQTTLNHYGFRTKDEYKNNLFRHVPAFQPDGTPSRYLWDTHLNDIFSKGAGKFEFVEYVEGRVIFKEVEGIRANYNNDEVVVTYSRDITQLKELLEERRRMEIAEESSKAKSRFLARMSHEIRTPITAVLGISEINLQDPGLAPNIEEAFAKIFSSASTLLSLVNDILDISKIEAGKMTIHQDEYEVATLINDAAHLYPVLIRSKDIKFSLKIDENLPTALVGDYLRIEQILNNLISNAFKYTESGMVELSVGCRPSADDVISLEITVRDTGFGMTREQIDLIYRDFSRFHEREKSFIGGTGLGIPIVCSLVEMMSGSIDFQSKQGEGTTVTVVVPQIIANPEILGHEAAHKLQKLESAAKTVAKKFKLTPESMPYGSVLVVDDVDANLFVAQGLLKFYDLKIETCTNGYDAIEKVRKGKIYDIIFMDHMMPGINGVDTMLQMRELGYAHPIVVLTANAMIGQAEEFMNSGFNGFISKPIQTKHLNTILVKHIKDKQTPEILAAVSAGKKGIDDFLEINAEKLKTDFKRGQKNTFNEIKRAVTENDYETARRHAHNIKSLSALIGETKLSAIAEALEEMFAAEEIPSRENLKKFKTELGKVLDKIAEAPSLNAEKTLDKATASALFDKLQTLLASRNSECVQYVDEIKKIPESAVLVRQIEEFDFSLASGTLKTLRAVLEV
ncbi:MAG: response regulator [Defluviitaleaceae bacterium]|nr:response regulator [Defluviitaleaceae bacterium]